MTQIIVIVFGLLVFVIYLKVIFYCRKQAKKKNRNPDNWALLAALMPLIAPIILSELKPLKDEGWLKPEVKNAFSKIKKIFEPRRVKQKVLGSPSSSTPLLPDSGQEKHRSAELPSVGKKLLRWLRQEDTGYSCPECGSDLRKEQKYCPNCGSEIDWNM